MSSARSRRNYAPLVAIAAVMTLAACSGGADPAEGANGGDTDAPIELLSNGDADVTQGGGLALTQIIDSFGQESGVEVTLDRVPFDQFLAAATTRARAGELGDVVQMLPGGNFSSLFGSLRDLSVDEFEGGAELDGWPSTLKSAQTEHVYAGVPVGAQGAVWYYNRALFEDAGLDPDSPPETWDDLLQHCDALNDAGIKPLGMSGGNSFNLWWAWSSLSPQFFTADEVNQVRAGEIPLDDERFRLSLEPLLETYERGCWNEDFAGKTHTDIETDFAAGEIAIVPAIISNASNWEVWDEQLGNDAYGVFGTPMVDGATSDGQFFNPVQMYGVKADSENPEAAIGLIEALASVEGQEIFLREASQFPNRPDVDVVEITGSQGAGRILEIVQERGGVDVAQNQFNGAAQQAAWTNLTQTMLSGDIDGFLADLQAQQSS